MNETGSENGKIIPISSRAHNLGEGVSAFVDGEQTPEDEDTLIAAMETPSGRLAIWECIRRVMGLGVSIRDKRAEGSKIDVSGAVVDRIREERRQDELRKQASGGPEKVLRRKAVYMLSLAMVLGAGLGYALGLVSWNSSDPQMTRIPVMTNIPVDILKNLDLGEGFRRALERVVQSSQRVAKGIDPMDIVKHSGVTDITGTIEVSPENENTSFERLKQHLEESYGTDNTIICEDTASRPIEKCRKVRLIFEESSLLEWD